MQHYIKCSKWLPSASMLMRKRGWNRSTTLSMIACGYSSRHCTNLAFSSSLSIQQCLITALSSLVNGMKMSLDYLKARVPVLWELEYWFWSNSDLNPMYYWVRDDLEARVCRHPIDTMEELKVRIVKCYEESPPRTRFQGNPRIRGNPNGWKNLLVGDQIQI